ncbi:WW domain-containing oxidoreductase [Podospora australis]|uniref:WW domain-containing oxidoreductase n=1 Tax=Podospora australis TaxID=1536484 RepID=A0AAN6WQU2_9PEZI|nr:WW domain-containing oxidoreductase [Podospora australis]
MSTITKTIVATGASSGLGFELVKQLLSQPSQPYNFILGARDVSRTQQAYSSLNYDNTKHSLTVLPLELNSLKNTKTFAQQTLEKLGSQHKLDYLLLNAGITDPAGPPTEKTKGQKWCDALVVNHLAQHYLIHLLKPKLLSSSPARVIVVSSGSIRRVSDVSTLEQDLRAGSGVTGHDTYSQSKFVQLLGAHWWRRQFTALNEQGKGDVKVVAVSPGLIPATGIGRGAGFAISDKMPDAKTVPEGAQSIFRAFTRDDFPEDPDQIFLTSWGEWWSKDTIEKTLDKELQDKWCPSKEEIEQEEGLVDA